VAKTVDKEYLPYLGYAAAILSMGFMHIYLTDSRQTGPEVFGDKIWWDEMRPIHSVLYGLFAYNAINQNENAWIFLVMDAAIGLGAFVNHHF
jgi:hypothetical protein